MKTLARRLAAAVLAAALLAAPASAQVTDYLGVPGPIRFDGKPFELAWSSRPTAHYTKQEYVPPGQRVENYSQMLLVETVTGKIKVMDAVRAQVATLNKRKGSDPLVNMSVTQNETTGEALLDFIVSSKDAKGEYIVEWNAYRYAPRGGPEGSAGVVLFGISHRSYGNDNSKAFMGRLKDFRPAQINALAAAPLPQSGR
jgi:hypothetical protein